MAYFLCGECEPPLYLRSWSEVEKHEKETGHTVEDDSPEWTI